MWPNLAVWQMAVSNIFLAAWAKVTSCHQEPPRYATIMSVDSDDIR
jgi:hypothetical protein